MDREAATIKPRGEATRAMLIEVARELFADRGYGLVSIEEILTRSGFSRGALYHHFRDKRDLFRAVFEQVDQELVDRVAKAALDEPDPWARLTRGCGAFLDECLGQTIQRIVFVDAPAVLGWSEWRDIDGSYALGLVRTVIEDVMEAGVVERRPVEPLAHVVLGALNEAGMVIADASDPAGARAEVGAAVMFLLEGVRRDP